VDPALEASFSQLANMFKDKTNSGKSPDWLYAVRRVYVDYKLLEADKQKRVEVDKNDKDSSFESFQNDLKVGHRMTLTKITDINKKKDYIGRIVRDRLSVSEFIEAVKKELSQGKDRKTYTKNITVVLEGTKKQFTKRQDMIDELIDQPDQTKKDELKKLKKDINSIQDKIDKIIADVQLEKDKAKEEAAKTKDTKPQTK